MRDMTVAKQVLFGESSALFDRAGTTGNQRRGENRWWRLGALRRNARHRPADNDCERLPRNLTQNKRILDAVMADFADSCSVNT